MFVAIVFIVVGLVMLWRTRSFASFVAGCFVTALGIIFLIANLQQAKPH
jgi:uncharacterized membrane protein SirB2